jgi:hypothetical protein
LEEKERRKKSEENEGGQWSRSNDKGTDLLGGLARRGSDGLDSSNHIKSLSNFAKYNMATWKRGGVDTSKLKELEGQKWWADE